MSGLISAAAERLRAALSLVTGAGMIGYSTGQAYTAGSLGAGLRAEEAARGALALSVGGDVAAVSNAVANLADEVDANATAASDAVAVVQGNIDTISLALAALIKPGFSVEFSGPLSADPVGWFIEDGRDLNVADEPGLFAAIGYTWGGAGPVFKLPDTRDDFTRGAGPTRPVGTREAAYAGYNQFDASSDDGDSQTGSNRSISGLTVNGVVVAPVSAGVGSAVVPVVPGDARPRNVAKFKIIKR